MNRAVQEREYTVRKEKQRLEQEAVQEGEEARVRRERTVSLAEMDKEVKIAEAAVEWSASAPRWWPSRRPSRNRRRRSATSRRG
ncbi:MAG: hypothetical protein KIT22_01720 [Verrucomicrobiae bacterium]|nr:hypothetical protein [Verrucomicrobiae bacterium]